MPHINSKLSGPPLGPNPYSVFSQLANSPYASLHPLALKRLFEEEYYLKSLFSRKSTGFFGANFPEKFNSDISPLPTRKLNSVSGTVLSCSPSPLSPSPSLPSLFLPCSSHIDTNNNAIPTSRFTCHTLPISYNKSTFLSDLDKKYNAIFSFIF